MLVRRLATTRTLPALRPLAAARSHHPPLFQQSVAMSSDTVVTSSTPQWRPHVLSEGADDWVKDLDLSGAASFSPPGATKTHKPRILVLYGSLRETSFSRQSAYECARVLDHLGADVRVFDPQGLPVRDPALEKTDAKALELRALAEWSEGHVWVSPEMHGTITGVMKNQIDWIPLNTGSVRPTQGKTVAVMQVNGGSQSFNAVNALRLLARWMRMPCCTNQSSVAKVWQEFEGGRMKPSDFRDRVVDVMEEFFKLTLLMREHADFLVDRYSERKEKEKNGRLLSQAEKEATKAKN